MSGHLSEKYLQRQTTMATRVSLSDPRAGLQRHLWHRHTARTHQNGSRQGGHSKTSILPRQSNTLEGDTHHRKLYTVVCLFEGIPSFVEVPSLRMHPFGGGGSLRTRDPLPPTTIPIPVPPTTGGYCWCVHHSHSHAAGHGVARPCLSARVPMAGEERALKRHMFAAGVCGT